LDIKWYKNCVNWMIHVFCVHAHPLKKFMLHKILNFQWAAPMSKNPSPRKNPSYVTVWHSPDPVLRALIVSSTVNIGLNCRAFIILTRSKSSRPFDFSRTFPRALIYEIYSIYWLNKFRLIKYRLVWLVSTSISVIKCRLSTYICQVGAAAQFAPPPKGAHVQ